MNDSQKIRHYRARSTEEERRMPNRDFFFTSCGAYVNCAIMAMLYTHSIGNQLYNTMVLFKIRDSVPSMKYSSASNVLRLWRIWLIPTYRIYQLYGICAAQRGLKVHALACVVIS